MGAFTSQLRPDSPIAPRAETHAGGTNTENEGTEPEPSRPPRRTSRPDVGLFNESQGLYFGPHFIVPQLQADQLNGPNGTGGLGMNPALWSEIWEAVGNGRTLTEEEIISIENAYRQVSFYSVKLLK